jgi:toluene monooxygenase system ferredoxin subunit
MTSRTALRKEELWIGEMVGLDLDGRRVLIVNVDGDICAYEDRCLHKSLPLSLGKLVGNRLFCRAHEWEYDACTGRGINPAGVALHRYEVQFDAGEILVKLDAA